MIGLNSPHSLLAKPCRDGAGACLGEKKALGILAMLPRVSGRLFAACHLTYILSGKARLLTQLSDCVYYYYIRSQVNFRLILVLFTFRAIYNQCSTSITQDLRCIIEEAAGHGICHRKQI